MSIDHGVKFIDLLGECDINHNKDVKLTSMSVFD
jgi:hypothetical protein